jgi:excisionase family DNA binding protein
MTEEQVPSKQLLTVSDVAEWLNVSGSLVYQLVESKKIPVCRIGNGRGAIRFRHEDIEAYIASCVDRRMPIKVATPTRSRLKHIKVRREAS